MIIHTKVLPCNYYGHVINNLTKLATQYGHRTPRPYLRVNIQIILVVNKYIVILTTKTYKHLYIRT